MINILYIPRTSYPALHAAVLFGTLCFDLAVPIGVCGDDQRARSVRRRAWTNQFDHHQPRRESPKKKGSPHLQQLQQFGWPGKYLCSTIFLGRTVTLIFNISNAMFPPRAVSFLLPKLGNLCLPKTTKYCRYVRHMPTTPGPTRCASVWHMQAEQVPRGMNDSRPHLLCPLILCVLTACRLSPYFNRSCRLSTGTLAKPFHGLEATQTLAQGHIGGAR